ncbi:putative dihydrodipicolinate synthase [Xylariaceae sp. FL0016]|nr:putative dihydrodipicolinate synthase [Xylariaceae sp. FL0016]
MPKPLTPGLYGPLPTFFDDDQEIDFESYKKHLLNLASKGIGRSARLCWFTRRGGPSGKPQAVPTWTACRKTRPDASAQSYEERQQLIQFIRTALDEAGLADTPIVAGVGGSSTRETIQLARAASEAGADAGLVILPAYYAASLSADQDQVYQYYVEICAASPIPLFLYNFPANSGGQDISSEIIEKIIKTATNLCGVKLTCGGSVGKLIRLASAIENDPSINGTRPHQFLLLDGLIADLTPWMQNGGHGTVSGIPNFAPAASVRLWHLLTKVDPAEAERKEARRIQAILSNADVAAVPAGVRGMKYVLHKLHGFGKAPRRPLLPLREMEGERLMDVFGDMLRLEAEVAGKVTDGGDYGR